mgnify:CR=1 FL=1
MNDLDDLERIRIIARLRMMGFKRLGNTPRTKYLIIAYKEGVKKALEELEMDYIHRMIKYSTYARIRKMLIESEEIFRKEKDNDKEEVWTIEELFE